MKCHGLSRFVAHHAWAKTGSSTSASAHINNLVVHIIFCYGIGWVYGRCQVFNGESIHVQVGVGGVGEDQRPLGSLGRAGVVVKTGGGQGCSGVEYHERGGGVGNGNRIGAALQVYPGQQNSAGCVFCFQNGRRVWCAGLGRDFHALGMDANGAEQK